MEFFCLWSFTYDAIPLPTAATGLKGFGHSGQWPGTFQAISNAGLNVARNQRLA
jgi:hypothetical protein